jgi:sensor histidine kinase YesM
MTTIQEDTPTIQDVQKTTIQEDTPTIQEDTLMIQEATTTIKDVQKPTTQEHTTIQETVRKKMNFLQKRTKIHLTLMTLKTVVSVKVK